MRLNHYLALCGIASRRAADKLITEGKVAVNGHVTRELGTKINQDSDEVLFNGQKVSPATKTVIYVLNKPRGVVTTASDPEGKPTVVELVPSIPRVFPCGRLDEETMGLVILTNDGNLCYQLTHPKFEHEKEYIVHGVSKEPATAIEKLRRGVQLNDGAAKADKITDVVINKQKIKFTIIIHEGRNRIVRRMCARVGIEIITLTRIRVGKYVLGDLEPGKWRVA